ncbi:T9SS type A sorting domain-containing protein [Soonwooa sp.]|uniref:T9SS type A sorting domain-containing protein n=1 Tax=Soonwooa sp. TaxID=1938592 RepID=UPI002626D57D|nr:T9SS type A sorting domain-containing protein [Soonwooa sp.]
MKLKLLLIANLASISLFGQMTITKTANDPVVGDVINNVIVNGMVDNSAIGANSTFNNASLTSGDAVTNTYSLPTVDEITTYPGTTIKHSDGNGTSIFYKQSSSLLEITGITMSLGSLNFKTTNAVAMKYPMSFGNIVNTNNVAAGSISANGVNGYIKGPVTLEADAWGTLVIGSKTYQNILRVKAFMDFKLYLLPSFTLQVGTLTNTMYSYFDMSHKYPVLMSTDIAATGVVNQSQSGAQAINEAFLATTNNSVEVVMFYPNPATDVVNISGNKIPYTEANIYSVDGKLVKTTKITDGKVIVADLPKGNYMLKVSNNSSQSKSVKIIKK